MPRVSRSPGLTFGQNRSHGPTVIRSLTTYVALTVSMNVKPLMTYAALTAFVPGTVRQQKA